MVRKVFYVCVVGMFVLCALGTAWAGGQDLKNYLVFKGGIYYPQGDLRDMDTDFNGEIAYGFRFHPNFAFEVGSGYFQTSGTDRATVSRYSLSLEQDVYSIPLTVAVRAILPICKNAEIYAIGGGGAYYVHGSATFTVAGVGRVSDSDDAFVAGGFAGAGALYNLTPQLFVGLEGKYLWTDTAKLRGSLRGVEHNADFQIEGVQGTVNIGYRF
jgi:opacity protein-like surface antigen